MGWVEDNANIFEVTSLQLLIQQERKSFPSFPIQKVSEKDSSWLSSGHILFLANGQENVALKLIKLGFMSPLFVFFCGGERVEYYNW